MKEDSERNMKPTNYRLVGLLVLIAGIATGAAFRLNTRKGAADLVKDNIAFAEEYHSLAADVKKAVGKLKSRVDQRQAECKIQGLALDWDAYGDPECGKPKAPAAAPVPPRP